MILNVLPYPLQYVTGSTLVRHDTYDAWLPATAKIIEVVDLGGGYAPSVIAVVNAESMSAPLTARHFVLTYEQGQIEILDPAVQLDYVSMLAADIEIGRVRRYLMEIVVEPAPEPVPDPDGWGPCTRCAAPYDGHGHCHTCGAVRMRRRDGQPMGAARPRPSRGGEICQKCGATHPFNDPNPHACGVLPVSLR